MSSTLLHSTYIQKHPYFTARRDGYITAGGKTVDPYFVVELPPAVVAMAVTASNEIILVKQYRHPVNKVLMELPGGFIDENESPEKAVLRELLEETGYSFKENFYIGKTAANPGLLNNYTHMFLLTGGVQTTVQALDNNEEIEIIIKQLEEVKQMLLNNEFLQSLHALCLFLGFEKLNNISGR